MEILVVEDDFNTQQALSALLSGHGASVTCAATAAEARRLVAGGFPYDVIVSDLELPDHDGLWLVTELRRMATPEARPWTILLTGSTRPDIESQATHAGFDLCLRKPIAADALLQAIGRRRGTEAS